MHENPEKRDNIDPNFDLDINPEGRLNDKKTVEKEAHKKLEKRDGASSSYFTHYTRQSSTKTEAVLRYVDFPF